MEPQQLFTPFSILFFFIQCWIFLLFLLLWRGCAEWSIVSFHIRLEPFAFSLRRRDVIKFFCCYDIELSVRNIFQSNLTLLQIVRYLFCSSSIKLKWFSFVTWLIWSGYKEVWLWAGVCWSVGLSFWQRCGWLLLTSGRRNSPRLTIQPPSRLRGPLAR